MMINDNDSGKPSIEKIQYNIEGLEHDFTVPELPQDAQGEHDFEQEYKDFQEVPAVRVVFENGAKLQILMAKHANMPIEEVFKADDPHSVWGRGHGLNGFDYNRCDSREEKVVFAAQADIDEYQRDYRRSEEDFSDWEMVREGVF